MRINIRWKRKNNETENRKEKQMDNEIQINVNKEMSEKSLVNIKKQSINEGSTAVWIDKLLNLLRKGYFSDFFEKNEKWLTKCGLYGLYLSAILGLIASWVLLIRYELPYGYSIGIGVAWFFVCIVIHYIAWKFLPAIYRIINSTPTKLSSRAFLDSLAVVMGIAGVISLFSGIYLWAKTSSFELFVIALFIFIFCEYILSLCLKPSLLNIEITKRTTAGEEFIGLFSFFMKSFLKLIPIMFGSGIIFGIFNILELFFMKFEYMHQIIQKVTQVGSLTAVALLPVAGYFLFLVYYFIIDLATTVLSIPSKIEALQEVKMK